MSDPKEREPVDTDTICTGDCCDCPNGDEDGECTRLAQEYPSRDLPATECGGWERP